ncbi:hypothetical protein [Streptomyces sp. NPDC007984]|uniref:hypothetical protein n=1 Tax=Streptomyces sp. NPDC007984 TaxID=3364801 RepID=UPI0036F16985
MRSLTHTSAAAAGFLTAIVSLVAPPPVTTTVAPRTPAYTASAFRDVSTLAVRGEGPLVRTGDSDVTTPRRTGDGTVAGAARRPGFGWWPYALCSALVVSLAVPVATGEGRSGPRGERRGGRHAGRARR